MGGFAPDSYPLLWSGEGRVKVPELALLVLLFGLPLAL